MNKSRLFLFYIISTSIIFSSQAMELVPEQQGQLSNYVSILSRLQQRVPLYDILSGAYTYTVNGAEAAQQAYRNAEPMRQAVANTSYQIGMTAVSSVQALYKIIHDEWSQKSASNEQSKDKTQLTFDETFTIFDRNMESILSLSKQEGILDQAKQEEAYKKEAIKSLKKMREYIHLVRRVIYQAKGKTDNELFPGLRETTINCIIEELKKITTPEAINDFRMMVNHIGEISKTQNGQCNLQESTIEQPITDNNTLVLGLESELEKAEKLNGDVFSEFKSKYPDASMQAVIVRKQLEERLDKVLLTLDTITRTHEQTVQELRSNHAQAIQGLEGEHALEKRTKEERITELATQLATANTTLTTEQTKSASLENSRFLWRISTGLTGGLAGFLLLILYKPDLFEKIISTVLNR